MTKKIDVKIGTKEENFWTIKKELSEELIKAMKEDLEDIPRLIEFHEVVIDMCEKKIQESKYLK